MLNLEELLSKISVEKTRDRTVHIVISKFDPDYAYGQMKLSEETSRQCVFALTGRNCSEYYWFKEKILGTRRHTDDIPLKERPNTRILHAGLVRRHKSIVKWKQ